MGLDMYLHGEICVQTTDYKKVGKEFVSSTNPTYLKIMGALELPALHRPGLLTVQVPVMYWRKSNQIHKWFVDECQNGNDDCQHTSITSEQLRELLSVITEALESKDASVLPPCSGFFFGSTEVDEDYWQELKETQSELKELLKQDFFDTYIYHASW